MIIIFLFFHSSSIACGGVAAAHIFSICVKKGAWCSGAPFEFAAEKKKMKQREKEASSSSSLLLLLFTMSQETVDPAAVNVDRTPRPNYREDAGECCFVCVCVCVCVCVLLLLLQSERPDYSSTASLTLPSPARLSHTPVVFVSFAYHHPSSWMLSFSSLSKFICRPLSQVCRGTYHCCAQSRRRQ